MEFPNCSEKISWDLVGYPGLSPNSGTSRIQMETAYAYQLLAIRGPASQPLYVPIPSQQLLDTTRLVTTALTALRLRQELHPGPVIACSMEPHGSQCSDSDAAWRM